MLVSTKGRYALRVMLELAGHTTDEYMRLDKIAAAQDISEKYLESIVSILVKSKIIEGMRGRGGGYRLTRKPEDYSVGEILRLTEGSLAPVSCLDCKTDECDRADKCQTRPMWIELDNMICNYLDSVKISDLLNSSLENDSEI